VTASEAPLLEVHDLSVAFDTPRGLLRAVEGVSFSLARGRTLGIVGESGSGKSACVAGLLGLSSGRVSGSARFEGAELVGASEAALARVRGDRIGLVFQDTASALNPSMRLGAQVVESLAIRRALTQEQLDMRAVELLSMVGFNDPVERARSYPHELSGGLRQRALIAMALACGPSLLVADEPTTALDATVQAQVMGLIRSLQKAQGMALLLVTHDFGLVAENCDDMLVTYAGRVMEWGPAAEVLARPRHPYTAALLASTPLPGGGRARLVELSGTVPDLCPPPAGCRFRSRCARAEPRCATTEPALVTLGAARVRCLAPLAEAA
jgi:oligopeptide/dipeptide ABC transporter ATP-binding protein